MDILLQEIKQALSLNLYYLSISITLSLPDICAALESSDGATSRAAYIAWCDKWFNYEVLTSEDLYRLRCGVLHQGRFGHKAMTYGRILFTLPNEHYNIYHNNILNDALNLDTKLFCQDMMESVSKWYDAKKLDSNVVQNISNLVQFRPNGFAPYMVGMPLIT